MLRLPPLTETAVSIPGNLLIARLAARDRRHLLARCEPVALHAGLPPGGHPGLLQVPGAPAVYLPEAGAVSLQPGIDDHPGAVLAVVGREGLVGAHWPGGVDGLALAWQVELPGTAWRLPRTQLALAMDGNAMLRLAVQAEQGRQILQLARGGACLQVHQIGPRLARWLWVLAEHRGEAPMAITHERLAAMLGARRAGVSMAAGELQRRGLIHYHRGLLRVTDAAGLRLRACSCLDAERVLRPDVAPASAGAPG